MKNYLLIAAIAIVAVAATGGGYMYYLNQTKAAYVVMIDITDDIPPNMDTTEVPRHIARGSSEWSATDIRVSTFSNFQNNRITTLAIPAQFPLLGNPNRRGKQLQDCYRQMLDTLDNLVATDAGRPQSVIYVPMVEQLNWLAASDAHIKEAFFYSDCQENNSGFSLYRRTDFERVTNRPEIEKAYFEKQVPLQSLKGVTVYFIYDAPTPFAEGRYLLMAKLWGDIFKAHGARVITGSNLITN